MAHFKNCIFCRIFLSFWRLEVALIIETTWEGLQMKAKSESFH